MSESSDDLSAVAWVHEELRRSIEAAHKALRRFAKETETLDGSDVDAVDPAVLRTARAQLHQGVGALELVGLPAAALVLRASEALVQRAVAKPATDPASACCWEPSIWLPRLKVPSSNSGWLENRCS